MNDKPIVFTGESIRAILDGRKTQTRRVVDPKCQELPIISFERWIIEYPNHMHEWQYDNAGRPLWISTEPDGATREWHCPFGEPGTRLWAKETWTTHENNKGADCLLYKADVPDPELYGPWKSPLFMPRWASRITLEVSDVRVERLQSISEQDALDEGIGWKECHHSYSQVIGAYADLWDSINKSRGFSWESSPWVWIISFQVVKP